MKWKVVARYDSVKDVYSVYVYTVPQTSDEPKYALRDGIAVEVPEGSEVPVWAEIAGEHKSLLDAFANLKLIKEVHQPWNEHYKDLGAWKGKGCVIA